MDLNEFLNSTAGLAVKGALIAAFVDFAFGVFAALRDGSFQLDAIAAFVRKHLLGRVFPVSVLAIAGYLTNDPIMIAAGAGALTAYAAETLGSIYKSLLPKTEAIETAVVPSNPVPTD